MIGRKAIWWVLRVYQLTLSAIWGRTCRFEPTCSHYAQEAVMRFGVLAGGWLALKRLARCHPWGGSGFDPVPSEVVRSRAPCRDCDCSKH